MLEESFEQLNQKQCAAYLKKLKLPQEECTLEFLDRLIRRHLEEIPFENLDLVRTHELIQTDLDTVYKKIIQGRRGGYCFELNALFLGLLRDSDIRRILLPAGFSGVRGFGCLRTEPVWSVLTVKNISVMWVMEALPVSGLLLWSRALLPILILAAFILKENVQDG